LIFVFINPKFYENPILVVIMSEEMCMVC